MTDHRCTQALTAGRRQCDEWTPRLYYNTTSWLCLHEIPFEGECFKFRARALRCSSARFEWDFILCFCRLPPRFCREQDVAAFYGTIRVWDHYPRDRRHLLKTTAEMESIMSLGGPLKHFTSCMSGKNTTTKRGEKRSQSVRRSSFTRRKSVSRRRSLPCSSQKVPDSWLRIYQAELKRER